MLPWCPAQKYYSWRVEGSAGVDYLIDYNTGHQAPQPLPEAARLTASYQVTDATPGRKPLIQGFRTEYALKAGTLGFTHLSRRRLIPTLQITLPYF